MKALLKISSLLACCMSFGSYAQSTLEQLNAVPVPPPGIYPPPLPCEYSHPPLDLAGVNYIQPVEPIYIGLERYYLNNNNFNKLYYTKKSTCPGLPPLYTKTYTGYKLEIPVYNDYGQKLFFDISGTSSKTMELNVSCGSFSASDKGRKFVISHQATTQGSCQSLTLNFSHAPTSVSGPSFNLSVSIGEEI